MEQLASSIGRGTAIWFGSRKIVFRSGVEIAPSWASDRAKVDVPKPELLRMAILAGTMVIFAELFSATT